MFSFIKKYTETMDHSTIYPIFSLLVFVAFFVGVLWYVKVMDKKEVDSIKQLPLEN
jgi:cytochrome c oxidase cbb3-type subunit 3